MLNIYRNRVWSEHVVRVGPDDSASRAFYYPYKLGEIVSESLDGFWGEGRDCGDNKYFRITGPSRRGRHFTVTGLSNGVDYSIYDFEIAKISDLEKIVLETA